MKYTIKLNYEAQINATNEEDAERIFWEEIVYAPQSDPASFIMENLEIKEN